MSAAVALPVPFDLTAREIGYRMNLSLVAPATASAFRSTPPLGRSIFSSGRAESMSSGHRNSLSPARTQSPVRKDSPLATKSSLSSSGLTTERLFCSQCSIGRPSSSTVPRNLSSSELLISTTQSSNVTSSAIDVNNTNAAQSLHALASAFPESYASMPCPSVMKDKKDEGKIPESMSPHQLAARIGKGDNSSLLVLDCRSFISFNVNHVKDAVNLCSANRVVRKRLQSGKVQLSDLINGDEGKDCFREKIKQNADLVVYDDNTTDPHQITPNTPLYTVISSLKKQDSVVFFLQGGLNEFQSRYNHLCAKPCPPPSKAPLYSPTTPIVHSEIDTATASKILPFLYIGNERDAANRETLRDLGVTHVLNATSHLPLHFLDDGITYKRLPASDSANQNLKQYFNDAFQFIDEARMAGGRVLIHCQAGVSRSSTLTIAYIMKHSQMAMMDAFKFVKNRRAIIAPNFNFMGQLLEFETLLNEGKISRDLDCSLGIETVL